MNTLHTPFIYYFSGKQGLVLRPSQCLCGAGTDYG